MNNYLQGHRKTLSNTQTHCHACPYATIYTDVFKIYKHLQILYISMHKHRCLKWPHVGHTHTHTQASTDIPVFCPHANKHKAYWLGDNMAYVIMLSCKPKQEHEADGNDCILKFQEEKKMTFLFINSLTSISFLLSLSMILDHWAVVSTYTLLTEESFYIYMYVLLFNSFWFFLPTFLFTLSFSFLGWFIVVCVGHLANGTYFNLCQWSGHLER